MKILLIGKTGQIGYALERRLQSFGQLIAPDRSQLDLSNLAQVRDIIRSTKPSLIINAAAYTDVDRAEDEPETAMLINAHAPEIMAAEAKRASAAIIHYSTDYVFDGTKGSPYTEEDAPNPVNAYGRSKLAGEQAIQASGVSYLILRTSWVYGTRRKNFLRTIQHLARTENQLKVVDDQFGTPTSCATVAENTSKLIDMVERGKLPALQDWQGRGDLFHLSDKGQASRIEFARAVLSHGDLKDPPKITPVKTSDFPMRARRPENSALCCEKLEKTGIRLSTWQAQLELCLS